MTRQACLPLLLFLLACSLSDRAYAQAQIPPPPPATQTYSADAMEPDQRAVESVSSFQQVITARLDLARHVLSLILKPSDLAAFLKAETETYGPSDSQKKLDHRLRAMDKAVNSLVQNAE